MTLAEFGKAVGVSSIGHMSEIERGGACSVRVALAIEALSSGRIDAAELNADVALVVAARAEHTAAHTSHAQHASCGSETIISDSDEREVA